MLCKIPRSCEFGVMAIVPALGATDQCELLSRIVHAPPTSAEPQPLLTVRPNVSDANAALACADGRARDAKSGASARAKVNSTTLVADSLFCRRAANAFARVDNVMRRKLRTD